MNYLIVVAHPDDEVLGAGATIAKLTAEQHEVSVCILSANAEARNFRPNDEILLNDTNQALDYLGIRKTIRGDFPNIKLNTVPHLEKVQFIERAIIETGAQAIFTHHPSDTNNDHMETSLACQAAIRLFQRNPSIPPMKQVFFMETLSATEWSVNTSMNPFRPNTFVEIGETGIKAKIHALSLYRDVMRDYPHPRSPEALEGLAAYRGAQAGCKYAEAFECVFQREL